jgi:thiol-disulfide isomerase/thioredoxin
MAARFIIAVFLTFAACASGFAQHADDAFAGQNAPELKGDNIWINSKELKLEELRGKVVLIDFWAYDCPNCAQSLPHIKEWHAKYAKQGLVIIGVHTPRIDYEKDVEKVKVAVSKHGIEFPVVIDNKYGIWSDYACDAWPTHYLVDQKGVIRLSHSGTGRYEETEKMIQQLLGTSDGVAQK